jgi:hypothetical protein
MNKTNSKITSIFEEKKYFLIKSFVIWSVSVMCLCFTFVIQIILSLQKWTEKESQNKNYKTFKHFDFFFGIWTTCLMQTCDGNFSGPFACAVKNALSYCFHMTGMALFVAGENCSEFLEGNFDETTCMVSNGLTFECISSRGDSKTNWIIPEHIFKNPIRETQYNLMIFFSKKEKTLVQLEQRME